MKYSLVYNILPTWNAFSVCVNVKNGIYNTVKNAILFSTYIYVKLFKDWLQRSAMLASNTKNYVAVIHGGTEISSYLPNPTCVRSCMPNSVNCIGW